MAFLAVTSLMRTLEFQFLHPQPRVTLSNKEQIKCLHEKLGCLLVFLEKFEKSGDQFLEMREVTEKIIDVTVKADDDIEADLLKVHSHRHKLDETLQRVVDDVEELMRITSNTRDLVNSNLTDGGSSQHTSHVDVVHEEADAMVGRSEELNEVTSQLLRSTIKTRLVISVVGMGGIGKTTFAKRIYEDPTVKSHFDKRGWTTMSLEHNKGQAILDLCRCVYPPSSAFNKDLENHLRRSLLGHRYLIIVDDIWTTEAWDDIHRCFPDENNGSRILLTTRAREIAQYAGSGEYSYNMSILKEDEAWGLFYQKFLHKEVLEKVSFKEIAMKIVQKCQGLPLTVVVIAGLLSRTDELIDEWENVERRLNSLVALDLYEQLSKIFTLSYNHLPSHLKGCFLYLGVFHEDSEIPVKKLIRLWIAEGFVETMSHRKRLEEVGRNYLQDLIDRSLVMVNERSFDGKIKTCRMHDLLHELCTSKAKNENLLKLETTGSRHRFDRFVRLNDRWLSLKVVNPDFHFSISSKKLRSILCFNSSGREWYLLATSFKKLRVLDLSKINFRSGVPRDITDLVFLRYLALASSMLLNHIPLDKNWNLQTLIISGEDDDDAHELLPHGIWNNLQQLRHLEINHKLQVSIDLLKVQENMHTLYWLSISQCTAEVFKRIPNVKELGIVAGEHDEVLPQGLNNLCCLNYLEKLRVDGSDHPLHLPPQPQGHIFPKNLKELTFSSTCIPWSDMSIISMLPNLEVLKLKNSACTGQVWELIEDRGFPQLKVLIISLTDLKEWKAYVDSSFPKLERLKLKKCFELKQMPDCFEGSLTLQLIKLVYCSASLVCSANHIKEEQLNIGNDIFDVLAFHTQPDYHHVDPLSIEEGSSE
ncbi:putative late blight resistance protein homolog R1B-17 isoform X2 [Ipomoea triloba]|uniref:putative late blight resistance protein homolog R1B-17 isoform X2 n=1 Tax=Ipomoea triloba TaxID=35885 RepID=UPI00125D83AB|nr:putative late blight resistance protein homolog R1B-17 isoform X2 [Ipomoea triloba]XP_031118680.1 putative late blight resistance protein homolog R1B-17 isoform X2 [Ipomoea triloba]